MDFTDYDTRLAAYAALVDDRDRILLGWFNGNDHSAACWTMPGGGVDFDQSAQDAVVRELFEETGYVVEVGRPLTVHHFTDPVGFRGGRPFKSLRVVFDATITGGRLGTTEVGGTTDYAEWVPIAAVPTLEARADIVDVALAALGR